LKYLPFQSDHKTALIDVWEASVRATHHFLSEDDISFYRALLEEFELEKLPIYCAWDNEVLVGFGAVVHHSLEMLFLHPNYIGKGYGTDFFNFLNQIERIEKVEVNEENPKALQFYEKCGFTITGRRALDDHGQPHPILEMRK
jgi:putative acetyltransferase